MKQFWTRLITSLILTSLIKDSYSDLECSLKEGKHQECIEISQCPTLSRHLLRRLTAETMTMLRSLHCGFDGKQPKVCCPRTEHRNLYLLPQVGCGLYEANRVIGGEKANLNEFPWMALLSYKSGNRRRFACSGSLINDKYVLTASHCLSPDLVGVRIGEHTIGQKKDCVTLLGKEQCSEDVQDFLIEKQIYHENYERKSVSNDVALIRLQGQVNMTRANANIICLPITPNMRELDLTNLNMTIAGWGTTETSLRSDVLLKAIVPTVSNENCNTIRKYLTPQKLCAGKVGKDSCKGDSGGPLLNRQQVENTVVYVQYGIVSYGTAYVCGGSIHGIYTRVPEYIDWILDHLEP